MMLRSNETGSLIAPEYRKILYSHRTHRFPTQDVGPDRPNLPSWFIPLCDDRSRQYLSTRSLRIDRISVPPPKFRTECDVTISNDVMPNYVSDHTVSFAALYDSLLQSKSCNFDDVGQNYFCTRLSFRIASPTSRM
jgi:hypothetical protein